jgi:hypothetical protein
LIEIHGLSRVDYNDFVNVTAAQAPKANGRATSESGDSLADRARPEPCLAA